MTFAVHPTALRALGALACVLVATGCSGTNHDVPPPVAKNVILLIGDGMQYNHEIAASRYLNGTDNGLAWHDSAAFPYHSYSTTWDVTCYNDYAAYRGAAVYSPSAVKASTGYDTALGGTLPNPVDTVNRDNYFHLTTGKWPATDSASAATAMATGYKNDGGVINWLPGKPDTGGNRKNDGSLRTIAEIAREERGMAIGVVSTVPFNHATPAGFVSHSKSRNYYYIGYNGATSGIADEIINATKPEVVIGGGHPMLDNPTYNNTKGYISQGLHAALRASTEYVFAERQSGVNGAATLAAAADKAVKEKKKLFGLFGGAGGNFEYCVPANAPGSPSVALGSVENPALKDVAGAAIKVLGQNPNGYFLMIEQGDIDWANHADDYKGMVGCMSDMNETVKSLLVNPSIDWNNTLLIITSDHGNSYMRLTDKKLGKGEMPAAPVTDGYVTYGLDASGLNSHTNELVSVAARGPKGALDLLKSYEAKWYNANLIDNTHLFHVMAEFLGAKKDSALTVAK